jgi:putative CocE/NonD family hydrolase
MSNEKSGVYWTLTLYAGLLPLQALAWTPEAASYGVAVNQDVPLTMADDTVLRADIYRPADASGNAAPGPFPVLLSETPYGKEFATVQPLLTGYESYLVQRGYIQVILDVRGSGASQGVFSYLQPQEVADSVAVIRWAAALPGCNGAVGMVGDSYMGMTQLLAAEAIGPDSPLKAIFPLVAANDQYRDLWFDGGLFNAETDLTLLNAYIALGAVNPLTSSALLDAPPELLEQEAQHSAALQSFDLETLLSVINGGDEAYSGPFWDVRSPDVGPGGGLAAVVANGIPAYLVGGLYDVFQRGEPLNYAGLQNAAAGRSPQAPMLPGQSVSGRYQLLIGPWVHTGVPEDVVEPIELAWFDHWLKDEDSGIEQTATPLHLMQPDGSLLQAARYPLDQATPTALYLGDGQLSATAPAEAQASDTVLFTGASQPCNRGLDQWALGGVAPSLANLGLSSPCDASTPVPPIPPAAAVYTTAPFAADMVLAGPVALKLYASTSSAEAEWIATLNDLAPDGSVTQISAGGLLGSQRVLDASRTWNAADGNPLLPYHPFTAASAQPITAGVVTRFDIEINPSFVTLPAGDSLQLVISTGDTPHLLPTPSQLQQLLGGVYQVQRNASYPSSLEVPLAPRSVFAATAVAPSPSSSGTAPSGGALGLDELLPLALAGLLRRRRSSQR